MDRAGFPADQLVLGVASYGHSFHVAPVLAVDASNTLGLYPAFGQDQHQQAIAGTARQEALPVREPQRSWRYLRLLGSYFWWIFDK